jgi:SAM-dependent methyltransferase
MTSDNAGGLAQGSIHQRVAAYYADKLRQHGPTPRGVDWRDRESQETRFAALLQIVDGPPASLVELGCGYGALYGYIRQAGLDLSYFGYDVSDHMIDAANAAYPAAEFAQLNAAELPRRRADYCVASGIFNVRFDIPDDVWLDYILATTDLMAAVAGRGFAFNCLTSHSDRDRQEARLYYADPGAMLNRCVSRYGRRTSLSHGNPPYEFTVLVRHDGSK